MYHFQVLENLTSNKHLRFSILFTPLLVESARHAVRKCHPRVIYTILFIASNLFLARREGEKTQVHGYKCAKKFSKVIPVRQ